VNKQVTLEKLTARDKQSLINQKALSRLHAQVLKLNRTVKEARGQRHLKLVKS